jgi:hypothetical protein
MTEKTGAPKQAKYWSILIRNKLITVGAVGITPAISIAANQFANKKTGITNMFSISFLL